MANAGCILSREDFATAFCMTPARSPTICSAARSCSVCPALRIRSHLGHHIARASACTCQKLAKIRRSGAI